MQADWIYLSRIQLKNDSVVQTPRNAPGGSHSESQHIATKSYTIALDPSTGLIRFQGYGSTRYAHVSGMKECDELAGEAAMAEARIKHAKATGQPLASNDVTTLEAFTAIPRSEAKK